MSASKQRPLGARLGRTGWINPGQWRSGFDLDRVLAWAASLNVLCLIVGLWGAWMPAAPSPTMAAPETSMEPVPIVEPPPAERTTPVPPAETAPVESTIPAPAGTVFVVAPETPAVAFAVPVEGATLLAPIKLASPAPIRPLIVLPRPDLRPATVTPPPPAAEPFTAAGQPDFPMPEYPRQARLRGWQGEVRLLIVVGADGVPEAVTMEQSSGHPLLDRHAVEHVQRRWRWPAGLERRYRAPIIFRLQ